MQIVDLNTPEKLAILPYGKPGSGKTTLLGTACDDDRSYPVLHVDVSGNPETLAKRKGRKPYVIRLQKLKELNAIFDWFSRGQPDAHPMCDKMKCTPGYQTLCFDGITAIQRKSFATVLGQELEPGDTPIKAEWPTYAAVLRQMLVIATSFLQELRSIHVIISCLEHEDQRYGQQGVAATGYKYFEPGLQGQAVTELPGEALAVMRLAHRSTMPPEIVKGLEKAETPARFTIAQLSENRTAYGKDQHHLGGKRINDAVYLADPTIPMLLDAIGAK